MGTLGALDQALMQVVLVTVEVLFPCSFLIAHPEMLVFCPYCCLII